MRSRERLSDSDSDVRGEAMRGLALRKDMRAATAILDGFSGMTARISRSTLRLAEV